MSLNDDHLRALSDTERAALAEIDRREGYEVRLLAALQICTAPLTWR